MNSTSKTTPTYHRINRTMGWGTRLDRALKNHATAARGEDGLEILRRISVVTRLFCVIRRGEHLNRRSRLMVEASELVAWFAAPHDPLTGEAVS